MFKKLFFQKIFFICLSFSILFINLVSCKEATNPGNQNGKPSSKKNDITAPTTPLDFKAVSISESRIELRWKASMDQVDNFSDITYEICMAHVSEECDLFIPSFSVIGELALEVEDLESNVVYYFQIRAQDSSSNLSEPSVEIAARTNDEGMTETPIFIPPGGIFSETQLVCINSNTEDSILCTTENGLDPECENNTCTYGNELANGDCTSVLSDTTLKAVACSAGMLPSSMQSADFTIDTVPAGVPLTLIATAISYYRIDLNWSAPVDDNSESENLFYEICYSENSDGCDLFISSFTTARGVTEQSVIGLNQNTEYYFSVRAIDEAQNISDVAQVSETTPTPETVQTPLLSPASGIYNSTQNVCPSSGTPDVVFCYTTDKTIPTCQYGVCTYGAQLAGGSCAPVGCDLTFSVIACVNGMLESDVTQEIYLIDPEPPSLVNDFTAQVISDVQIDLNWSASTDDRTPQ